MKETINKTKRQLTEWEKMCAKVILDNWLVSKTCKKNSPTPHPEIK